MKRGTFWITTFSILTIVLFSCGRKSDTTTKEKEPEDKGNDSTAMLTSMQMKAVGIEIGVIEQKNLTSVVKASGQLAVPPQNKAEVNVLFGGIVQKVNVLEGQSVTKGQTLALLENAEFVKLQQDYLSAKDGFTYTAAEFQRQKELKAADAGTGKVYQQAEANYNAERSRLLGLEKQLEQLDISPASVARGNIVRQIPVIAPISGTVGRIRINTGTYAEPAKPLMEIVDNSKIHADLTVFEKDLFKVHTGQQVTFTLTNQNNQVIQGEIYGVNKSFEGENKGIIVHAIIKANKYGLIPGMYVTALIDIGQQLTSAVPVDAIVRAGGKDYIFEQVDRSNEKNLFFHQIEVVTGITELGYTQITPLEPIAPGIKIITKGAFYVLSKSQGKTDND